MPSTREAEVDLTDPVEWPGIGRIVPRRRLHGRRDARRVKTVEADRTTVPLRRRAG